MLHGQAAAPLQRFLLLREKACLPNLIGTFPLTAVKSVIPDERKKKHFDRKFLTSTAQ